MTLAERLETLIDNIDNQIATNGTQSITALVLNPILQEIVDIFSTMIGDTDDLDEADLISQIAANLGAGDGITILSGTADPNVTPPGSFETGDFYKRVDGGGATVGWFQNNGQAWAEIERKTQQNYKGIRLINSNESLEDDDLTLIYNGSGGHTIDQDTAANNATRIVKVVNQHNADINFTNSYKSFTGADVTAIPAEAAIEIQSDGTNWYRIS